MGAVDMRRHAFAQCGQDLERVEGLSSDVMR
jgi:hypothetical protein